MNTMSMSHTGEQAKTVTKMKFFTVDEFEKEQEYLQQMSLRGCHLKKTALTGLYTFSVGAPKKFTYRINYKEVWESDRQNYLQMFDDAGWEYVSCMPALGTGSWDYFRKETAGDEEAEIFTDTDSRLHAYRTMRKNWSVFFLVLMLFALPFLIYNVPALFAESGSEGIVRTVLSVVVLSTWGVVAVIYARMFIRLTRKIRELEDN